MGPATRRAASAAALVAGAQAGGSGPPDRVPLLEEATGAPVASSTLHRSEHGIRSGLRTHVRAGHAHTLWYVIFNAPEGCSGGMCGPDDLFLDPDDRSAGFNAERIAAARASVVWAGAGAVADRRGRLRLNGALKVGEVPAGPRQVAIGRGEDGAVVPLGVVTGLENPRGAVIVTVLQDHGRAHRDPALRRVQLTSFEGACNPECEDVQFAVHAPR
jgi:hypothetical protein